jgi:hypothetical protein
LLSVDDRLEPDRHPLSLTAADAVATNGVNPWNWRDTSTNGTDPYTMQVNTFQDIVDFHHQEFGLIGNAAVLLFS